MTENSGAPDSNAEILRSVRHLMEQRQGGQNERQGGQNERPGGQNERPSATKTFSSNGNDKVHNSILYSMFTKGRGKRRFPAATLVPAKRPKPLEVAFHLLPKPYEKTPTGPEQLVHLKAGLGCRTANLDESTTHNELCHTLKVV
ncbi:hypothetical protein NQZ68_009920 [Dissostichus eleginoides]|nr:hypothetical protein NQZ68_009920 [Dissostichus eleginoides]